MGKRPQDNKFVRLRLNAGLTQTELAKRIGKHTTDVARWERGEVRPSLKSIRKLSDVLTAGDIGRMVEAMD